MSLPLPKLDDRTWADLVDEARAMIPGLSPEWTDHNPSEPGITLIELFAWLAEMLIYRADQLPDEHYRVFLRLLNGPDWQPGPDLAEDLSTTVVKLRRRFRAVTPADYEALAREAAPQVARVRCVPRRNLASPDPERRRQPATGHVSLVLLPANTPQPSPELIATVRDHLEPRRLVTTRNHFVGPIYVPLDAEIFLARTPDAVEKDLGRRIITEVTDFLDPLKGGPEGDGWPFGRDVYVSELHQRLHRIPGVDHVTDVHLRAAGPLGERETAARPIWHPRGDLVGVGIEGHQLPCPRLTPANVVVARSVAPVRITVRGSWNGAQEPPPAAVVRNLVRTLFDPRSADFNRSYRIVRVLELEAALAQLAELDLADVELDTVAERRLGPVYGEGVELRPGELAELTVTVELS